MCSHEKITWKIVNNSVTDRMIDNSFVHKFVSSRIRKRTKVLNTELKKHGEIKAYKQYVSLKTTLLRTLTEDSDTDNIGILSDVDYNIIYSTPLTRAKYVADKFNNYSFTSEEDSEATTRKRDEHKNKNKPSQIRSNTKKRVTVKTKKPSKPKSSKKHISIGWQNVIKKKGDTSYLSRDTTQTTDEENVFKDEDDYPDNQSNDCLNLPFDSDSAMLDILMKPQSGQMRQNDENSNMVVNKLCPQSNAIFSEAKSIIENESQEAQSTSLNEQNSIESKSQSPHYKIHLSESNNLEKSNNSHNDSSIVLKLENNSNNELTEINSENSINMKNCNSKNRQSLENVRKNLISALEEIDFTNNENIKKNEIKDESNCDQSLLTTINFDRSSTLLKKTQVDVTNTQDSLLNSLLPNQQQYSNDEHSPNNFVENKQFNLRSPTSFLADIAEEMLTSPPQSKKVTLKKEVTPVKLHNSKQNMKKTPLKHDLKDSRKQDNKEEKKGLKENQLNQIDAGVELIYSIDQKDKINKREENNTDFIKSESSCNKHSQIQQLSSPKESCVKNEYLKSDNDIVVEHDNNREVKKSSKKRERNNSFSPYKSKDKNVEIYSINHENEHSVKLEDTFSSTQKQQLSPKKCIMNENSKSHTNISEKLNNKETKDSPGKRERKDSFQANKLGEKTKTNLINHENKIHSTKSEDLYNYQEQLFPKKNPMKSKKNKKNLESHDNILEMQNGKVSELSFEEEANKLGKKTGTDLINHENKIHSTKSEDLYNSQEQLSPKKNSMKSKKNKKNSESHDNILEMQNGKVSELSFEEEANKLGKKTGTDLINHENKIHSTKSEDLYNSQEQLSPKKNPMKSKKNKKNSESHDNILEMQNGKVSELSFEEKAKNSNEIDKSTENDPINHEDKAHFVKSDDSHNIQKQQILPKIICTEFINKKYKIINESIDDIDNKTEKCDNINNHIDVTNEDIPIKNDALINGSINCDANNWQQEMNVEEINNDIPMTYETDNEEDNIHCLSPQSKKRLQQQAMLNLIVYSESSESDDEKDNESSKKRVDSSDTRRSSEDDASKNDGTTHASNKIDINGSHNENSNEDVHISSKESTSVSEETINSNSTVVQEEKKKEMKTKSACENNLVRSNRNENLLQNCENVHNDDSSSLDKENIYNEDNKRDKVSNYTYEFENRLRCKRNKSTQNSHVEFDTSCNYRPCNLQQLVEDEELVMETIPASFTLADLSEDDEAFILDVPSKVLQCNLQNQSFTVKEKTIKLGQNKFIIAQKEMNTTSCIFATGKQQKPYKTVNIKNISIVTVRERLPRHLRKSNSLNLDNSDVSFELKSSKINETESKISKNCTGKRKRSSDSKSTHSMIKEKRLKVYS